VVFSSVRTSLLQHRDQLSFDITGSSSPALRRGANMETCSGRVSEGSSIHKDSYAAYDKVAGRRVYPGAILSAPAAFRFPEDAPALLPGPVGLTNKKKPEQSPDEPNVIEESRRSARTHRSRKTLI
jgi:hypothetical protein